MSTARVRRAARLMTGAVVTATVAMAAVPIRAAAQNPGSLEAAGFASWTKFDGSLGFSNRVGGGGLLGLFLAKNVALEGEGTYTKTHFSSTDVGNFKYIPIRGRVAWHVPLGSSYSRLIFGAGYVAGLYRGDLHVTNNGFTGLVGLLLGFSRHVAFRADGVIDYYTSPFNQVSSNQNYSARAGISILLGSYPPNKDSIRADSVQRAERARADSVQRAAQARADSARAAEEARADSVRRAEEARADSARQAAAEDSLRRVEQARADSARLAQQAGVVDSIQMELMLARKKNLILTGVTFAPNKAQLSSNAMQVLNIVAQSLKEHPDAHVEVAGYTDSTGSAALNRRLSQNRAQAVRAFLIKQGVPAEQLTAKGYGPANPIAPNDTPENRAKNRRVELHRTM